MPINLNVTGLHYAEEYWGSDAASFNPNRWDRRNGDSVLAANEGIDGLSGPGLEYGTIHKPVRGSFIPFSDGVRACMGKKFSQVEFVVALSILFRDYRMELAPIQPQESMAERRQRAEQALEGSSSFITLSLQDRVPFVFHKRTEKTM